MTLLLAILSDFAFLMNVCWVLGCGIKRGHMSVSVRAVVGISRTWKSYLLINKNVPVNNCVEAFWGPGSKKTVGRQESVSKLNALRGRMQRGGGRCSCHT